VSGVAKCAQPGCAGTMDGGYCDTCGMAPRTAAVSAAPGAPLVVRQHCGRPRCDGTIEDGYCDTCGMAAQSGSSASARSGRSGAAGSGHADGHGHAGGGGSTASGRTGSARGTSSSRTSSGRTRGSAVSARTGSGTGRTGSTRGSRSTGRGGLGLGLVEIPQVQYRDPAEAVLANPQVPEHKRFCSQCATAVGRGRDGRPGRINGFCAKCGGPYDFTPKLAEGELVAGQYEVLGCIAHGGLGWIYLARDNNVSGRWVALKGLLDAGDADAMAAAVAERQFLAEVEHPNIVKIYNFVRHATDRSVDEYIVMEYVGGKSLKQIALDHKNEHGGAPLPLEQVLAYAIEVLPAFGYLHSIGLIYCDLKPDNIIQSEEQLKLIDMGAVLAFGDEDSAVYGTVGYQAPEIAQHGPSIESDLFTVGRMMAVLAFDFKGATSTFATTLPDRESIPVFARFESFYRAVRRATHERRERRFSSSAEMAEQLTGVLREVLALTDGTPRPAPSTLFTGERASIGTDLRPPSAATFAAGLPIPQVDPTDSNAGFLATLGGPANQVVNALSSLSVMSDEARYRLVRATLESGDFDTAATWLDLLEQHDAFDWRVDWYRGLLALAQNRPIEARSYFEACYNELPGELAPKLAIAAAADLVGDRAVAMRYYSLVWAVDRGYASTAFALARLKIADHDHAGAVEVLGQVPEISIHRTAAEIDAIRTRLAAPGFNDWADARQLAELAARVEALGLDGEARESLVGLVLLGALGWLGSARAGVVSSGAQLFGAPLTERSLRLALERSYRARARMAAGRGERIELVDRANSVRPRTLV
jgi:serine/threonine-protein kinase PknG